MSMEIIPYVPRSPYSSKTPAFVPILADFARGSAIMGLEWTTLKFIEDAPVFLRVSTFFISLLVLAVLRYKDWLDFKGKRYFAFALTGLLIVYVAIAGYAYQKYADLPNPALTEAIEKATVPLKQELKEANDMRRMYELRYPPLNQAGSPQPRNSFPDGPILARPLTRSIAVKVSDAIDSLRGIADQLVKLPNIDDILPPDPGPFQQTPWLTKLMKDGIDKTIDRLSELDGQYQKLSQSMNSIVDADNNYSSDLRRIIGTARIGDMHYCLANYIAALSILNKDGVMDLDLVSRTLTPQAESCVQTRRDYWRWRGTLSGRLDDAQREVGHYLNAN